MNMITFTKRLCATALSIILIFCLLPATQASAANDSQPIFLVEDLGNGITVETTITVDPVQGRSSTKKATAEQVYKKGSTQIATISLTATFGYDGSKSWVVSTSYSKSVASGWSYSDHKITTSGGTAKLTANLKKSSSTVPVSISMNCSASGTIS